MELRSFVKIFADRKNLFFGVWLSVILLVLLAWRFQPSRYEASLLMNVARRGTEETQAYQYDHFYRLQADERFADTVVRWLTSPSIRAEIAREAEVSEDIVGTIAAKRLSSQMIDVRYRAGNAEKFRGLGDTIVTVLNREAEKLNELSKDPNWFTLVADQPVVLNARVPFWKALLGGIAAGLFLGFWIVMARWYWKK